MSIVPASIARIADDPDAASRREALSSLLTSGQAGSLEPMLRLRLVREIAALGDTDEALREANRLLQNDPDLGALLLKAAYLLRETPSADDEDAPPPDSSLDHRGDLLQSPELLATMYAPLPDESSGSEWSDLFTSLHASSRAIRRASRIDDRAGGLETAWALLLTQYCLLSQDRRADEGAGIIIQMASNADRLGRDEAAFELAAFGSRRAPNSNPLKAAAVRHAANIENWQETLRIAQATTDADPENRVGWSYQALVHLTDKEAEGDPTERLKKAKEIFDRYGNLHDPGYLALLTLAYREYDPLWIDSSKDRRRMADEGEDALPDIAIPDRPDALLGKAEGLLMGRRFEEALELFDSQEGERTVADLKKDGDLDAAQTSYLFLRGFGLFWLNRQLESYACFSEAIVSDPRNQQILMALGQTSYYLGRYPEAISYLLEIQPVGPDDYCSYYTLGLCYDALGDRALARRALEQAYAEYFFDNFEEVNLRPMMARIHRTQES